MNPKTQAIIEEARKRTEELLRNQYVKHESEVTKGLPSSVTLTKNSKEIEAEIERRKVSRETETKTTFITTKDGTRFDPYEIAGVGRANEQQSLAIRLFGIEGKSGCLIGPAGTGKTTTMRAILTAAIQSGRIPILSESFEHKYLRAGLPGIYGGAFTRIATRNLRNNCPPDIQDNIHTHHRLLEFEPEQFVIDDPKTGKPKTVRLFKPTRNAFRTLPRELIFFVFEETSMLGTRLHGNVIDAIHPSIKPQMLYLGDIAQLPPVMDDAILGYKMLDTLKEGTCVELKEVYRHAGAIVNLANRIRVGNTIPDNRSVVPYLGNLRKLPKKTIDAFFKQDGWTIEDSHQWFKEDSGSKVTIKHWKNRLDGEVGQLKALQNLALFRITQKGPELIEEKGFFIKEIESGNYDPMKHMILMPYNKAVGTIELNRYISNYLGRMGNNGLGQPVYEIIAGREKHYFAVGDKVFHEREEAIITKININANYAGRAPQAHSIHLDRWGHNTLGGVVQAEGFKDVDDIEMLLNIDIGSDDDERKNQASHVIHIKKILDLDRPEVEADSINTAAEVNGLLFGYALTIHKSQGSQWPKVYCVFHNSHNRNLQRELLYTAITRAQKELYVICEPESFIQGVISQHIIGNTLEEKARFFVEKAKEAARRKDLFTNGPKANQEEE